MSAEVQFCLLGPVVVRCGGVAVPLPEGKQTMLLAVLLLRPGRVVAVEELAELLWASAAPPPSAPVTVRNYVKRLRQALSAAGLDRIVTQAGGYLIRVEPDELDVWVMEDALAAAHRAVRNSAWRDAAWHAGKALRLWRGEPLSGLDVPMPFAGEFSRLTELRLQAHELRIEADLQLGLHAVVVTELRPLTAANPMREHLLALLMLALYRCGRRAEALQAYRESRAVLIEEAGSEPGPALQTMHQQILRDDPALALSSAQSRSDQAGLNAQVPQELPAAVRCFTGRDAELNTLSNMLCDADAGRTVVISAIAGTAGVGKTAIAVHWAHQIAGQFPDGQLYVNLRGYDPDQPLSPAGALAGFLGAMGVLGPEIPDDLEDRARLYRSKLTGRRVLVLLDNARDSDQVRPLLPGHPGCVAVVTSRDALAGLVATDGARRLGLDVLSMADASALLQSLIGPRADADPEAMAELAALCARLPLALRIVAELAVARPATRLRDLVDELASAQLDWLDAGEDRAHLRAVFSWSVRHLPGQVAEAFALVGLHPGEDLDVYAAAALTGTTAGAAGRMLDRLRRASLLQAGGPGRYEMHDLLRAYAREQAAARDSGGQRDQAMTALFDYYLAAAAAAMDVAFPAEAHNRPRVTGMAAVVPAMPSAAQARAWLDAERANLAAAVAHCARHGWPEHAARLAGILFRYLMDGCHLAAARAIYGHALEAARRTGDAAAEAEALNGLGGIGIMNGRFRDAIGHYQAALERYRQRGDRAGEAKVLRNLGITELHLHNHKSAVGYLDLAIAGYQDLGDTLGAARALVTLAGAEIELDSREEAWQHLQRALPVFRAARDQAGEAEALSRMGDLSVRRGQLTEAATLVEQALAIFRHIGRPAAVATELCNLGEVSLHQGEHRQAISYLRQGLALLRQVGDQHGEVMALRSLAEVLHAAGRPAAARSQLQVALRLAADTGNTYQQATAHRDLAESHHHAGQSEQACGHWQQALDLYTQLGRPEADQMRSRLTAHEARHGATPVGQATR